jgi:hypothetical protein
VYAPLSNLIDALSLGVIWGFETTSSEKGGSVKQMESSKGKRRHFCKTVIPVRGCSFFILVAILIGGGWLAPPPAAAGEAIINCDAHNGICTQSSGDLSVSLEISPRPVKAMQDLVFRVTLKGTVPASHPHIDLGMPAMKMGPNQVVLKPIGPGTYEGTGVIVRCKSGKRTWFANVVVPDAGEVKFIFDVIY